MIRVFLLAAVFTYSGFAFADFKIIDSKENEDSNIFRVNTTTGEAWLLSHQNRWIKVLEHKPLRASDYEFTISRLDKLLRMNSRTGETWYRSHQNRWSPVRD